MSIRLYIADPHGFCGGVTAAIQRVRKALSSYGPGVVLFGPIVHNEIVNSTLRKEGAFVAHDESELESFARETKPSCIICPAHGLSPIQKKLLEVKAKEFGCPLIDATCPLVQRIHNAAKRFASQGYHILLLGDRNHAEVLGVQGEAPEQTTVVRNLTEIESLSFPSSKIVLLAQTTLNGGEVEEMTKEIRLKFPFILLPPEASICSATRDRQRALDQILSKKAEENWLVLVVGDPSSSNSKQLCKKAEGFGAKAYLIRDEKDLCWEWFQNMQAVVLTSGASTPEEVFVACKDTLQRQFNFESCLPS